MNLKNFPNFPKAPIIEVVLGIQFKKIDKMLISHLGLLWDKYRNSYPIFEQKEPLDPVIENFGQLKLNELPRIQLTMQFPQPRCWFINQNKTSLIQIQQDRFIFNWRKTDEIPDYPGFASIMNNFFIELRKFQEFIRKENLGELSIEQCELTYVNHILRGNAWKSHSEIDKIIRTVNIPDEDNFLPQLEESRVSFAYIIKNEKNEPFARMRILVEPKILLKTNEPIYEIRLITRGLKGNKEDDVKEFFDIAHNWIVKGFNSITTKEIKDEWRKNV